MPAARTAKRKVEHAAVSEVGNPPKWPGWGIYNYKAVVAYDGTNYRCVCVCKCLMPAAYFSLSGIHAAYYALLLLAAATS